MKKLTLITSLLLGASVLPLAPREAAAEPTITSGIKNEPMSPYLRGFAEMGFGVLFGAVAGGTPLITGVFVNPKKLEVPLTIAAVLYPAGVASGMLLGGYLTESYSNYWAPFVGAYVGAAIADLSAYFLAKDYPTFSAMFVLIFPVITSMVATEVSHYHHRRLEYYPIRLTFPF